MSPPRCPVCNSAAVEPHIETLEASDERFPSTHRCTNPKCRHESFRYTPPVWENLHDPPHP